MKTIYKYTLENIGMNEIEIPVSAEYLKVYVQYGKICLWALVNPESKLTKVRFLVIGTGWDVDELSEVHNDPNISKSVNHFNYIDTIMLDEGRLVLHVFKYHKY